ncbi:unnamed protein product [Dovyalis caffra]|uniref:Wax synthase domain-containing protein n=1 Tax=Dovyalis caffra TaxID=77055 RepID=A0AAV1S2U4_9ROSI|nr:unnamed protein product [Dovyalis caffra]
MEGEIYNFVKVWISVFVSLTYCYVIGKVTPKGIPRLLCVLPIVCLFLLLPLEFTSIHFGGLISFFIAWLANFKLLLFAFGKGPLCLDPKISFGRFVSVACFPIKIQQIPPRKTKLNGHSQENQSQKSHLTGQDKQNLIPKKVSSKSFLIYAAKILVLALLVAIYGYGDYIHPKIMWLLYCLHIYFFLEIILAMVATLVRTLLGLELEPQFSDPYLSTSLQDFWGRRWNLMVTSILRPTVYEPIINTCKNLIGSKWAQVTAILGTFLVSALMHELIFYYLGRVKPTWEITWFFLLHGVCLTVEIALKKRVNGRWQLPRLMQTILTIGFVIVTGFWLLFPPFLRCKADVRALEEYAAVGEYLKNAGPLVGALARACLGVELEPQFDEPYLASSLQDFWGKRWNLTVTNVLHPAVFNPVRSVLSRWIAKKWTPVPAVIASFLVSGIMHELIFYHIGRQNPTWEVTCFFLLHGFCLTVEIIIKMEFNSTWGLPRVVAAPLVVGFVVATAMWLFMPTVIRCKIDVEVRMEMIASFKLLLFGFNKGPLFACKNYVDFVAIAIFPLKIKENEPPLNLSQSFKTLSSIMGRYELVRIFNKPYLATSLQDFWDRRWNRLSSNILRQTIYEPTQNALVAIGLDYYPCDFRHHARTYVLLHLLWDETYMGGHLVLCAARSFHGFRGCLEPRGCSCRQSYVDLVEAEMEVIHQDPTPVILPHDQELVNLDDNQDLEKLVMSVENKDAPSQETPQKALNHL